MSRVLVTGGAGYIGSHTVEKLLEGGFQVVVLDNLSTGHQELLPSRVQLIEGDVRDEELVRRTLREQQIQSIIHFAAFISVEESLRHPEIYYENNFGGTVSVLRACEGSSVENFIFSSTAAVYEDPKGSLVTEESPIRPLTPYGASKWMSEKALADFGRVSGLRSMILRYFNVAGASLSGLRGQVGDQHSALIKRAALAACGRVAEMKIFGTDYPTLDGTAVRDFIHIEDLADIHVQALRSLLGGGESHVLNCGYGRGFSVRQVIETMKRVSGKDFRVVEQGRRAGDLAEVVADNSKLLRLLEWKPKCDDLELICRTAVEWERANLNSSSGA